MVANNFTYDIKSTQFPLNERLYNLVKAKKQFIAKSLLNWSRKNAYQFPWRKNTTAYRILISELLLRRTRAQIVRRVFPSFIKRFPTLHDLSVATSKQIKKEIHTLGRTKRDIQIRNIAKNLSKKYMGRVPNSEIELLEIIGKHSIYTVNAVRCFAYGERVPVFDINVSRIISRVFSINLGNEPHKNKESWLLAETLLPYNRVKEFNWALIDLGRTVCISKPKCKICPLLKICSFANANSS